MFFLYGFAIAILGLLFGSFGSVLLSRLEDKYDRQTIKSILIGRSQCPKCKNTLKAKELIPLFSYLWQRGKCRHCNTPISKEYPILEIASCLIFLITFISLFNTNSSFWVDAIQNLIFWLGANRLLTLLIIHDIKSFELHIPLRIVLVVRIRSREIKFWMYREAIIWGIVSLVIFVGIYYFGKRYVKKRFNSNEEWFWQGDIFIWTALWSMFPLIWKINEIEINRMTSVEITLIIVVIASIIWIIYALIESTYKKPKNKQSKESDIFTEWRDNNKIIPFIPALILAFWILLYKADTIISFVF